MYNPIRRLVKRIERKDPFLLSHHPGCAYYAHHTFELYGAQLCMGCFVVYPVGIASMSVLTAVSFLLPELPVTARESRPSREGRAIRRSVGTED